MRRLYPATLLLAVVVGVTLRLAWCEQRTSRPPARRSSWRGLVGFDPPNRGFPWLHDEYLYYVSTAVNAFKGQGFLPDYNTVADGVYVPPPLQSAFMLALYRVHGRIVEPSLLQRWQVVFAAVMVLLGSEVARRLGGEVAGSAAAWLLALLPDFAYWPAYLQTESNYLVGLTALLLLLLAWSERPTPELALPVALVLGLLNLQRMNGLLLGFALSAFALLRLGRRGRSSAGIFAAVPLLVLAPWLARNLLVYREPILVNSNDGINFHVSNNISLDAAATPHWDEAVAARPGPFLPELERKLRNRSGHLRSRVTYYGYSKEYMSVARDYAVAHPVHFLRNYLVKLKNAFLVVPDFSGSTLPLGSPRSYPFVHFALLVGGLAGFAETLVRRGAGGHVIALVFGYFVLLRGLFLLERQARWDLPIRLLLALLLATTLGALWERLPLRRLSSQEP